MKIQLSDHFSYGKLAKFTLPSIAMMIFTSIYGVVDGFFVSNFAGKTAFAAVNLIMPILMILGSVGSMFGTGGAALVALKCGEGDQKRANEYFSLITYTAIVIGIVFALCGSIFLRPISIFLGADGELLDNCVTYGRVFILTIPFFVLQVMFQSFFIAAERPGLGLGVTFLAGITNMVLDAVLVIGLPAKHKLLGAALATAISQVAGGGIPLIYFACRNHSLLRLGKTRFYGSALGRASINGMSEFVTNISISLVAILFNAQLMKLAGENGVAAFGVMMYVSMIFTAVFMGYTMGVSPVISFHFGAENTEELKSLKAKSLWIVALSGIVMVLAAECLASAIAGIFVGYDQALYRLTADGFRIFGLSFGFMGFGIFISGFFTALNDGVTSAVISFLRTFLFACGAVMILPILWGIDGIWASVVAAEAMAFLVGTGCLFAMRKKYKY